MSNAGLNNWKDDQEVWTGASAPPPTCEQLAHHLVTQLTIDCEADHCEHKRRALEQSRAALKSLGQSVAAAFARQLESPQ